MINDIYKTGLQSLISVCILLLLARIMGKKQISQLTYFDYVVGISIGSIAAAFAVDNSIGYVRGITSMIVYAFIPIFLSLLSLKSRVARKVLDGIPIILIQNGRIVEEGLKKTKMNVNDLLEECRLKDVFNISDIEYAILETSGKLSVQLKANNQSLTPKDMNISVPYKGVCVNLIIDGNILYEHLKTIDKDLNWLHTQLHSNGIQDSSDVLLAFLDSLGYLNVFLKNNDPIKRSIF